MQQVISVRFNKNTLEQFGGIAKSQDRPRFRVVKRAVAQYLDYKTWSGAKGRGAERAIPPAEEEPALASEMAQRSFDADEILRNIPARKALSAKGCTPAGSSTSSPARAISAMGGLNAWFRPCRQSSQTCLIFRRLKAPRNEA